MNIDADSLLELAKKVYPDDSFFVNGIVNKIPGFQAEFNIHGQGRLQHDKKEKVESYLQYSRMVGTLESP